MSENSLPELPIVIVGKDRTRMTCAVIDALQKHIKNANPYFICVSDRSRAGHDKVIENHLEKIGASGHQVLRTLPEEDRYGWGAAMNLGLSCAFDVCQDATCALVVDNDWILQRDLDIDKYLYAFAFSSIGAITFKHIYFGTNVSLKEVTLSAGDTYLLRSKGSEERYSFTAELGCMLLTKRLYGDYGKFKENCKTDSTEWDFCDWYNTLSDERKNTYGLWFATDKELRHDSLNGIGHVFTHVGIVSQHEGRHQWDCPEEYKYLSDDNEDERVCKEAIFSEMMLDGNFWERNKVLFATNTRVREDNPLRVSYDLVSQFIPQKSIYCVPTDKFGKEAFLDIFDYGIRNGFDYVVYFDADCFIVNENNLQIEVEKFIASSDSIFAGPSDGGVIFHRCNHPLAINPFLLFVNLKLVKRYRNENGTFDFGERIRPGESERFEETIISWEKAYTAHQRWIEEVSHIPPAAKKAFETQRKQPYTYDYNSTNFEPYYDIFFGGKVLKETSYIFLQAGDVAFDGDNSGISSGIWLSGGEFSPERLICIHTWYSRVVLDCPLEYIPQADKEYHRKRILSVVDWIKKDYLPPITSITEPQDVIIPWEKYFDRIYCMCFLDKEHSRISRIQNELTRINLYNSPIFEMRYCINTPLHAPILNDTGWKQLDCDIYKIYSTQYLETVKIAYLLGYNRIMVIEDDAAFLKDKVEIIKYLDEMPNAALVQMDKFIWSKGQSEWLQKAQRENIRYFRSSCFFTGSTCNVFNRDGMEAVFECIEKQKRCADHVGMIISDGTAVATKSMAIQVLHRNSKGNIKQMHDCYMRQGIDKNYSDYAVPDGYRYGEAYISPPRNIEQGGESKLKGQKFISVYAIAKNEASVAARWYECVKEADEVCVLDTGSTDDTVKILRDLGAKVMVKTYDDWSFAIARNDSMNLVSPESEILFTLDLDETIAPGWRKKLEDAWIAEEERGKNPVGAAYKYIWSFYDDGREMQSFAVRKVHKNGVGKWKYRCHELLQEVNGYSFFIEGFVVEHHQNRQTSRSKYLGLLERDAKEMPEDDRSAYYYARELMYESRWEEAIKEFKRHLMLRSARWTCERASSMRNIAYCYRHLKNEDEYELWLWKSAEEDKTNREATYFLGEKAMEKKDYRTAVKVFERCVAIEEPSLEYISIPLVWSARPWFLYAQALWWVNRWNDAVEASKKAMEIEPDNAEVRSQYENMKATRDRYAEGRK